MSTDRVQLHSMRLIEKANAESASNSVKMTEQADPYTRITEICRTLLTEPYNSSCQRKIIRTRLQIKLPEGCYGRTAPITDLASFHYMSIGAGSSMPIFVMI